MRYQLFVFGYDHNGHNYQVSPQYNTVEGALSALRDYQNSKFTPFMQITRATITDYFELRGWQVYPKTGGP